jgi:micrococcal nuclease
MYKYTAKLNKIIDGDTLDIKVDLGFKIFVDLRVRLYGINTPEVYGIKKDSQEYQEGVKARDFVTQWFATLGTEAFAVKTFKDKQEKYGRWLVEVTSLDGMKILNEDLLSTGNAVEMLYE